MAYAHGVTWEELENLIRERAAEQKRGFRAKLAKTLDISPANVTKQLDGTSRIPPERIHIYLAALDLELCVRPKSS